MNQDEKFELLNGLHRINLEVSSGLREAAQHLEQAQLKTIFQDLSQQRTAFAHELSLQMQSLGSKLEKEESYLAKVHQAWIDLRSAIASKERYAIIVEVLRGEKTALDYYDEAIQKLEGEVVLLDIVNRHRSAIAENIDGMEARKAKVMNV